jgi:hypothetical protein
MNKLLYVLLILGTISIGSYFGILFLNWLFKV